MAEHARLSASGAYRWFACPGSPRLIDTVPPAVESEYAKEGTKAHTLAAQWLTSGNEGEVRIAFDDQEMEDAVRDYVEVCRSYRSQPECRWWTERKFDLSKVYPGCFGTADHVVYWPEKKHLIVIDFKYGSGVWVDPRNNPQLLYYGLGAVLDLNLQVETVELGICQPRCGDGKYRSVTIDYGDLLDFRFDLTTFAKATEAPDAPLNPGDHCRFCPASGVCPRLRDRANELAKVEFAHDLSWRVEDVATALAARETMKAFIKGVDEFAYAYMSAGHEIPGWKLVEKRATRKWKDEPSAVKHLIAAGYANEMFQPQELLSPAQMEKQHKQMYGVVSAFVVKESSGNTIAPESDSRPAVQRITAEEEFATQKVIDVFA